MPALSVFTQSEYGDAVLEIHARKSSTDGVRELGCRNCSICLSSKGFILVTTRASSLGERPCIGHEGDIYRMFVNIDSLCHVRNNVLRLPKHRGMQAYSFAVLVFFF